MKCDPSPPLTTRALNRALLARQMLLGRESIPVKVAIERLVGLQAQLAGPPFVGLWSRVESFERSSLLDLIKTRQVVRATMMRATIHLMSADDYIEFRECLQPTLTAAATAVLGDRVSGFDVAKVISFAESHFKQRALTFEEARKLLIAEFPDADERAMGYVVRTSIPLIMVPDDSENGYTGAQFRIARAGARTTATLKIAPFRSLRRPVRRDLEEEGERLARFLYPSAARVEIVYES